MRDEFALDENLCYLNSANLSISPRRVREAIARYGEQFERNPTHGLSDAWGRLWRAQSCLARFLHADPADLFLRQNVTSVLNTFLLGLPLPPRSEILVGEHEYGAIVNICRLRAEREGHRVTILKMPASPAAFRSLNRPALVDHVVSQLGPRTKLVLLSHVIGGTGLVLPLEEIARETRRRGILLVVDGAYAPGALDVRLENLQDVDAYGCSLYKWMLGPKGTAFGWLSKRWQDTLDPFHAGWTTFETPPAFSKFGEGNRFASRMALAGCHDFASFFAIEDTVAFWESHGPEKLRAKMRSLLSRLERLIHERLGWPSLKSSDERLNGPIAAFLLPSSLQALGPTLVKRLQGDFGVQAHHMDLAGKWYVVLSPHVYNTEGDIEKAVGALGALEGSQN